MRIQAYVLGIALLSGLAAAGGAASAAELAVPHAYRAGHVHGTDDYYGTGYVLWDDVYPPAIYGPRLRPVDEVAALKAQRQPADAHWWYGWYH